MLNQRKISYRCICVRCKLLLYIIYYINEKSLYNVMCARTRARTVDLRLIRPTL